MAVMSYLPPVEGPEIATSDDVAMLRHDIDRRFDDVDHRFEFLDARLEAMEHRIVGTIRGEMATLVTTQTRVIVVGLVGALTANTGLVLAASRLG